MEKDDSEISVAKESFSLISSQREFKSNKWMLQILLVERKEKLSNQDYDVVYLLIPFSSKMVSS